MSGQALSDPLGKSGQRFRAALEAVLADYATAVVSPRSLT